MEKERLIILFMLMFVALSGAATAQSVPKLYLPGLLGCGPPPSDAGDVRSQQRILQFQPKIPFSPA